MDLSTLFLEVGGVLILLAVLARTAIRLGLSPIPLYLLGGLAFGEGGLLPLVTAEEFIEVGAEIGVVLLLFMLGLEFSAEELVRSMRATAPAGLVDLVLNFTPGLVAGLLFNFGLLGALVLGGVTYISSSGVAAKLIADLGWIGNRETPTILSILVFEDLAMVVFLPLLLALTLGAGWMTTSMTLLAALAAVMAVIWIAFRYSERVSRLLFNPSDEALVLTILGVILLVAGVAERVQLSAAVGAFLVGIAVSGQAADRSRALLIPVRDLFAAVFFIFFGLRIDPASIPPVMLPAVALCAASVVTKLVAAWWGAGRAGVGRAGRLRAGVALIARGEFSIIIAGIGVAAGAGSELGPLAATYVLILAITGPLAAKAAGRRGIAVPPAL